MSDQKSAAKKLKMRKQKRFQHQFDDNPSWRTWVKEISDDPHNFFCLTCETTLVCEINAGHSKTQHVLEEDFNFNERVKIVEIRFATFFVEKNLPFSISSDLLFLMKDIAKEPDILQAMYLGRTKLTHIVNNVVCRQETCKISEILRENKFSIYKDETLDITNDKWLSLMMHYVESKTLHIFQSFENELLKKNISLRLIVGFSCDNASVMIDKTSFFETKLLTLCRPATPQWCRAQTSGQQLATPQCFFFLELIFDTFNKYNAKFYTRKSIIQELQHSSMELLFWFLSKFMKPSLLKSAGFGHIIRTNQRFLKLLQVHHRLGKLVNEDEVRNEWKFLYEVDLPIKVEWSKLKFDDMWRQINTKTRKRNGMSIKY
ncbi:hypothetical protein ACFW04_013837 [Cataglyphis niger]